MTGSGGRVSPAQSRSGTMGGIAISWKAAIWAGIVAGVVFMTLEMTLVAITGMGGFWGPPRMIAAMVLGRGVLPPPATFDLGVVMVAMVIHFALSLVYAVILAWIIARWSMAMSIAASAVFGLLIYVINFYGVAPVLFPWFVEARNWIGLLSHLVFGLVLAWAYKAVAGHAREG